MRILDISPSLPYPLTDGGRRAVFYSLRSLVKRGHSVHMICLADVQNLASVLELEKFFTVDVIPNSSRPSAFGALASVTSRAPYQVSRFHNPAALARARRLLESSKFDVLQAEGIHAAYYADVLGHQFQIPTVLRFQDLMSVKMRRDLENADNMVMKWWLMFDLRRLYAYEKSSCTHVSCNLMISEIERDLMVDAVPNARFEYVPTGVDLDEFVMKPRIEDPLSVLWLGALFWPPNRDSFWWFYNEIVPHIVKKHPSVKIKVAGSGTPPDILALRHPNVEVLGFVQDIRELISRSQVCVVPLRVGSGVRVKLLEMFALGRAVVSTTVGAEPKPRKSHGMQPNWPRHLRT